MRMSIVLFLSFFLVGVILCWMNGRKLVAVSGNARLLISTLREGFSLDSDAALRRRVEGIQNRRLFFRGVVFAFD